MRMQSAPYWRKYMSPNKCNNVWFGWLRIVGQAEAEMHKSQAKFLFRFRSPCGSQMCGQIKRNERIYIISGDAI